MRRAAGKSTSRRGPGHPPKKQRTRRSAEPPGPVLVDLSMVKEEPASPPPSEDEMMMERHLASSPLPALVQRPASPTPELRANLDLPVPLVPVPARPPRRLPASVEPWHKPLEPIIVPARLRALVRAAGASGCSRATPKSIREACAGF